MISDDGSSDLTRYFHRELQWTIVENHLGGNSFVSNLGELPEVWDLFGE